MSVSMTDMLFPVCVQADLKWSRGCVSPCPALQKLMVRSDQMLALPFEHRVSCQMCTREEPSPLSLMCAGVIVWGREEVVGVGFQALWEMRNGAHLPGKALCISEDVSFLHLSVS